MSVVNDDHAFDVEGTAPLCTVLAAVFGSSNSRCVCVGSWSSLVMAMERHRNSSCSWLVRAARGVSGVDFPRRWSDSPMELAEAVAPEVDQYASHAPQQMSTELTIIIRRSDTVDRLGRHPYGRAEWLTAETRRLWRRHSCIF